MYPWQLDKYEGVCPDDCEVKRLPLGGVQEYNDIIGDISIVYAYSGGRG